MYKDLLCFAQIFCEKKHVFEKIQGKTIFFSKVTFKETLQNVYIDGVMLQKAYE
jgi:hypothetical protein